LEKLRDGGKSTRLAGSDLVCDISAAAHRYHRQPDNFPTGPESNPRKASDDLRRHTAEELAAPPKENALRR